MKGGESAKVAKHVTKYVITSPECTDILPSDISTMVYDSEYNVNVKETCFGAIINGEEDEVESLVKDFRALDPFGIFIKNRGFPVGDPGRCRRSGSRSYRAISLSFGRRAGGARPGLCMIEAESKMLPLISRALAYQARGESETSEKQQPRQKRRPIDERGLKEFIKDDM